MTRALALLALAGYVLTVWAANYAVDRWGFVSVGLGLAAPAGVYLAGLALVLRDSVQDGLGRVAVVAGILAGAGLAYVVSPRLATASAAAFLLSEAADFAVYTPLRERGYLKAAVASNVVGAAVDSAVFLWLAFHSLAFWRGQVVGKLWVTLGVVALVAAVRATRSARLRLA